MTIADMDQGFTDSRANPMETQSDAAARVDETVTPATARGPAPYPGMVCIPAGTYRMGSDRHYPEEAPAHRVAVDNACASSCA